MDNMEAGGLAARRVITCTREIGIDAAHRVPSHGSKCRNLHGHRYTVQVTVRCEALAVAGAQEGMAIDFGFLKGLMMQHIDTPCDHGMILSVDDPMLTLFTPRGASPDELYVMRGLDCLRTSVGLTEKQYARMRERCDGLRQRLARQGFVGTEAAVEDTKLYIVPFVPTAENLAQHWFARLTQPVRHMTDSRAWVANVRVFETPNCFADYGEG